MTASGVQRRMTDGSAMMRIRSVFVRVQNLFVDVLVYVLNRRIYVADVPMLVVVIVVSVWMYVGHRSV